MDRIFEKIIDEKIKFNVCTLSENYQFFEKFSASDSVISFGSILKSAIQYDKDLDIVTKMFFKDNEGLDYEAKMYRYILDKILYLRRSPNFISYIAYGECTVGEMMQYYEDNEKNTVLETLQSYTDRKVEPETIVNVLALEKARNAMNAEEFFFREENEFEIANVFFQITHALYILGETESVHNDLHHQNILVSKLPNLVELYYCVNEQYYLIRTRYIVYLFDWDRGYTADLGNNKSIDGIYCENYGQCNSFNPRRDMFTVIAKTKRLSRTSINIYFKPLTNTIREQYRAFRLTAENYKILRDNGIAPNATKISSDIAKLICSDYESFFDSNLKTLNFSLFDNTIELGNRFFWLDATPPKIFPTPYEMITHTGKWTELIPTNLFGALMISSDEVPPSATVY